MDKMPSSAFCPFRERTPCFFQATEPFFNGSSGGFLDGLENLVLLDAREIIRGGWLPPAGHVESECSS
jgi:hypothetical protein